MTTIHLEFHQYKYFPYELRLARLETSRLLGSEPHRANGALRVNAEREVDQASLARLTYFRRVSVADTILTPQQALLEGSARARADPRFLRRQSTRYSAHGLHEYRGKFNPQIVRAALNLIGLPPGAAIFDPFCGSGTVLLEARHQEFDAIGVDGNPLATLISNAKIAAVAARSSVLRECTDALLERLERAPRVLTNNEGIRVKDAEPYLGREWVGRFANSDYLRQWFPVSVLAQLRFILDTIHGAVPARLRNVYRVVLSDIARDVSWQDPSDLRIRRRKIEAPYYPAIQLFADAIRIRIETILAAQEHLCARRGLQFAVNGDSRNLASLPGRARRYLEKGVDCIVTSPPYATALPYVDTQRLSIALLELANPREIRQLDGALVGSREITTSERCRYDAIIETNGAGLVDDVSRLCKQLRDSYDPSRDGFRRRNTPAVVYRYFESMTRAVRAISRCLKTRGRAVLVVGPNRTTLGGTEVIIDTPAMLLAIGVHCGLRPIEVLDLDAYSRFDLHSKNSIREERLLVLEKTA